MVRVTEAERVYEAAQNHLAGGVSAAARIHASLGGPLITARGAGGWIYDVDGRAYIDLNTSNGASLLGHGHAVVRRAELVRFAGSGTETTWHAIRTARAAVRV